MTLKINVFRNAEKIPEYYIDSPACGPLYTLGSTSGNIDIALCTNVLNQDENRNRNQICKKGKAHCGYKSVDDQKREWGKIWIKKQNMVFLFVEET
ncbi:hypothetical protein CVT25_013760 [Psilocybe cyanescens]|uniref:Uncharacterized protein n=1 Tax=Psilocybe cyanescens TaxID=93625 RepID=A0A409XL51_PSICY|nr:hypothetical protein CVT25_013760 [Psilocybe cyanescens]